MKLTKQQRADLKQKYGGRCAYCGCFLGEKWHADHIEPVVRNTWIKNAETASQWPERDNIENFNPACAPCNIDKHSMSLDSWRMVIANSNRVLERDVSTYRRALRFGLIQQNNNPIIFYFETLAAAKGE